MTYCAHVGCGKELPQPRYFRSIAYCQDHYKLVFDDELDGVFRQWQAGTEPSDRLRYLIGRYFSEYSRKKQEGCCLSTNLVRNYSSEWAKLPHGARFTVERRPIAWYDPFTFLPICRQSFQTWVFDNEDKTFTFLEKRKGDFALPR